MKNLDEYLNQHCHEPFWTFPREILYECIVLCDYSLKANYFSACFILCSLSISLSLFPLYFSRLNQQKYLETV